MNPELLLLEDICPLLHIGKATAYKLIKKGLIPAFKVGGKWLIKPKDLENYINSINSSQN